MNKKQYIQPELELNDMLVEYDIAAVSGGSADVSDTPFEGLPEDILSRDALDIIFGV